MRLLDLPGAAASHGVRLRSQLPRFSAPVLTAVAIAALSFAIYWTLVGSEEAQIERAIESEAAWLRLHVEHEIGARIEVLDRLARRWQQVADPAREDWTAEAEHLIAQQVQLRAIEWFEPTLKLRWRAPATSNLPGLVLDPNGDPARWREIGLLYDREHAVISRSFRLADGTRQMVICAPMFSSGKVVGLLVGVMRQRDLLDELLKTEIARGYSITVYEGPFLVFGPSWEDGLPQSQWADDAEIQVDDLSLKLQVWPSEELEKSMRSRGPLAALVLGLVLALAVGVLIYRVERWRDRARAAEAALSGGGLTKSQEIAQDEADLQRMEDEGGPTQGAEPPGETPGADLPPRS